VGALVYAGTESTKGDLPIARARLFARSGQGQQANVPQMDWSGLKREAHSIIGRERINLMEAAKDLLGGVEFAADVRGETSRGERSCRLADDPERGQTSQYKRV
jgi:hypothetical protein